MVLMALEPPGPWQEAQFWRMWVECGMTGGAPMEARVPPGGGGRPVKALARAGVARGGIGEARLGPGPCWGAWHWMQCV